MEKNDDKDFKELIKEFMNYKDSIGLKKIILEDKFSDEEQFWELLTILGEGITDDNHENVFGFFEACERCMRYIVKIGNPKELLLALLEQGDTLNDPIRFQTYLQLIQQAILMLPSKQSYSVELSLETLNNVIINLELPSALDLEGEERRAHDLDPHVDTINRFLSAFLDFLKTFTAGLIKRVDQYADTDPDNRLINCLSSSLMKTLYHPLVYLDLTLNAANGHVLKSNSRLAAERIVHMLVEINPRIKDFIQDCLDTNDRIKRMFSIGDQDNLDLPEAVPVLSLACLTYLIYGESLIDPQHSCLYSRQGIFENNLVYVLELMKRQESEVQLKGVILFDSLNKQLSEGCLLSYNDLDRYEYFRILEAMFDVMVHSSVTNLRQKVTRTLPVFIRLFDLKGRYQIFVKIFGTVKHSGAYGYCVHLFKNQLEEVLSDSQNSSKSIEIFCNLKLKKILLLISNLPDNSATDLIEHSDRLIAVLNFIRYLVLRDPCSENKTGFWTLLPLLEKDFLKPMQLGLDISKGHYKCELTGLESGKIDKSQSRDVEMSVSVAGFNLPKMDQHQKMEIMRQALNTLDLMTSLFVRVNELIEMKQKETKNTDIVMK